MIHVPFFVAFLGGILALLPACGPALLPAFFAFAFRNTRDLLKATALFGLGFTVFFIPFGLGVSWATKLIFHQQGLNIFVGIMLLLFGSMSLFGVSKGFALARKEAETPHAREIFILGLVFGLTVGSCVAPIFGAIATLAATGEDIIQSLLLLLVFEVGMLVPLLLLAYAFERNPILVRTFRQRGFTLAIVGKELFFSAGNIISGILFITLGLLFLTSHGSTLFSSFGLASRVTDWFFSAGFSLITLAQSNFNYDYFFAPIILIVVLAWAIRRRH